MKRRILILLLLLDVAATITIGWIEHHYPDDTAALARSLS